MSAQPPELRPVSPRDAEAIQELVHRSFAGFAEFAYDGWSRPPDRGHELIAERLLVPATGGWVAKGGGRHAGHVLWIPAAASERLAIDDADIAYLWQLFVDPAYQGSGLAARLVAAAVESISREGYTEVRLLTPRDHARARRFYEREGWSPLGDWGHDADLDLPVVEYGRRLAPASGQNGSP